MLARPAHLRNIGKLAASRHKRCGQGEHKIEVFLFYAHKLRSAAVSSGEKLLIAFLR